MKKLLIGVLIGLGLMLPALLVIYSSRCKDPTPFEVTMIQLGCARDMDVQTLTREACQKLHGSDECTFVDADQGPLTDIFFEYINKCARKTLKDKNFCADKYKDM